jgi:hypothetical protein
MSPIPRTAVVFVAIIACSCASLTAVLIVMPQFGIRYFPGFWMTTAAVSPLFAAQPMGSYLWRMRPEALANREMLTLTMLTTAPVAVIALFTEAVVVFTFLPQEQVIAFQDVLFAPFAERYSAQVLFGLSFFVSLVLATLISCLYYLPGQIGRLQDAPAAE